MTQLRKILNPFLNGSKETINEKLKHQKVGQPDQNFWEKAKGNAMGVNAFLTSQKQKNGQHSSATYNANSLERICNECWPRAHLLTTWPKIRKTK